MAGGKGDPNKSKVGTGSDNDSMMAILVRLESKVDNMKRDILAEIDRKITKMSDDIFLEIAGLRARIEAIEKSNNTAPNTPPFHPDETVIIFGLAESVDENIEAKIDNLILNGLKLTNTNPVACKRLVSRNDKPGACKVQFKDTDEKIKVLRAKQKLKEHRGYKQVYIRSSKSHIERLHELNMRMLLDEFSDSEKFGFTGSGRMFKKSPEQIASQESRKRTRSQLSSSSSTPTPTAKAHRMDSQVLTESTEPENPLMDNTSGDD